MKYTQQQFDTSLNAFQQADLSMKEREVLRARVMSVVSPQANMYKHLSTIKKVVGVTGALFFGSATIAFGSQYSEPGDLLYGVETSIVEPLVGAVIFDEANYREYQEGLARERIDEILTLGNEHELDDERVAQAERLFDAHIRASGSGEVEVASVAMRSFVVMESGQADMASDTNENSPEESLQSNSSHIELEEMFDLAVALGRNTVSSEQQITNSVELQSLGRYVQSNTQRSVGALPTVTAVAKQAGLLLEEATSTTVLVEGDTEDTATVETAIMLVSDPREHIVVDEEESLLEVVPNNTPSIPLPLR